MATLLLVIGFAGLVLGLRAMIKAILPYLLI